MDTQSKFIYAMAALNVNKIEEFKANFPTYEEFQKYSGRGEKFTYLAPMMCNVTYLSTMHEKGYDILEVLRYFEDLRVWVFSKDVLQKLYEIVPDHIRDVYDYCIDGLDEEEISQNDVDLFDIFYCSPENKEILLDYFSGEIEDTLRLYIEKIDEISEHQEALKNFKEVMGII